MNDNSSRKACIGILSPSSYFKSGILTFTNAVQKILSERYDIIPIAFNKQVPLFLYPAKDRVIKEKKKNPVKKSFEIINWYNIFTWNKAFKQIKDKVDILYIPWWTLLVSLPIIRLLNKAKKNGIKTIVEFHNVFDHNVNNFIKFITKRVLKRIINKTDVIIAHSRGDMLKIQDIKKNNIKITYIPHMAYNFLLSSDIEVKSLKEELGIDDDKIILLQFGIVRPYKGLEYSIEALNILRNKGYNVFLLVVGENWINKNQVYKKVRNLNLEENFLWIDKFIDDNEIARYYSIADISIYPYSAASGSGAAQLAFAAKKPVVASKVGGFKDTIKNMKNGLLCEPENAVSLAEKIEILINSPEIREEIVNNALRDIVEKYKLEEIRNEYYKIIDKLILNDIVPSQGIDSEKLIAKEETIRVAILQNFHLNSTKALSTYLRNIVFELSEIDGIELTVISCFNEKIMENVNFNNITVKGHPYSIKGNLQYTKNAAAILKKMHKREKFDIIHTLYPLSSLAASIMAEFPKKANVIYELRSPWIYIGETSGYLPRIFRSLSKRIVAFIEKRLMRKVKGFIFITEALYDLYKNKLPKNYKYTIIPSGINTNIFSKEKDTVDLRKKLNLKEDTTIIGYIGSLEKQRELDVLATYFKKALEEIPNIILVFIGEGSGRKRIENIIKNNNLESKIFILPPVSHEKIGNWINAFDICVSHLPDIFIYRPSFPLKILEYAALNKPVIASDMQPHRNFHEKYSKCYLYSDSESFILRIKEVLEAENDQNKFDVNEYSWKNLAKQIAEFYKEVLK
ncbi:MAG: glycosyltransferase family 4 protein [Candidatus Helarchaeota archaeon]